MDMSTYRFTGAVYVFGRCVADRWSAQTRAVSFSKARSNLAYQFKKECGLSAAASVRLLGEIVEVM